MRSDAITGPIVDRARELHDHGWSTRRIALMLGVSKTTVGKWVRPAGPVQRRVVLRCPECGISMRWPAERCGLCAGERVAA